MTKRQPRYDAIDRNADQAFGLIRRVRESAVIGWGPIGGIDRGSARLRPAAFDRLLRSEEPVSFSVVHPWRPVRHTMLAGGPAAMSTKTKTSTLLSHADTRVAPPCPWVRSPAACRSRAGRPSSRTARSSRRPTCRTCRSRSTTSRSCPTRTPATACRSVACCSPTRPSCRTRSGSTSAAASPSSRPT